MSPTPPWTSAPTARALKSSPERAARTAPPPPCRGGGFRTAGALAGAVNGLFGGGGGIVLAVLLRRELDDKRAFATCVAAILPLCLVSAAVYLLRGGFDLCAALPYLAGGLTGGVAGGVLFRRVPGLWLRRMFALFLLYGAWRYLR